MSATSRELVLQTLDFARPERAPRQIWVTPWATHHHPAESEQIIASHTWDVGHAAAHLREATFSRGKAFEIGEFRDDWGCIFQNAQLGVHGEVKDPLIKSWDEDLHKVHFPVEWFTLDTDAVNRDCDSSDAFLLAGCLPRPFEQLQFLRGTEQLLLDLYMQPPALMQFIEQMHDHYCRIMELWGSRTNVDALWFMDDWGSQTNLLIPPDVWRALFRPLYRDYIDIAHSHGKKCFMHSDGNILAILPDLIELGLDAINSQIFCMGLENLRPYAGQITFWGEIDRQHLLPHATTDQIDAAVREVADNLWRHGGCIGMCEFGPAARPDNVSQVFRSWDAVTSASALTP